MQAGPWRSEGRLWRLPNYTAAVRLLANVSPPPVAGRLVPKKSGAEAHAVQTLTRALARRAERREAFGLRALQRRYPAAPALKPRPGGQPRPEDVWLIGLFPIDTAGPRRNFRRMGKGWGIWFVPGHRKRTGTDCWCRPRPSSLLSATRTTSTARASPPPCFTSVPTTSSFHSIPRTIFPGAFNGTSQSRSSGTGHLNSLVAHFTNALTNESGVEQAGWVANSTQREQFPEGVGFSDAWGPASLSPQRGEGLEG
jgi:hypothetical protein